MITSYNAKILCISKQTIYNIVRKDPEVGVCLIKFLTTTIHHRDKRIESFMSDDAKDRVIQFLHSYATEYGQQVGGELLIKHDLTQQDIANYTGTSRQTVTTVLSDLKRKNKIFLRRKSILIRDLKNFSCG